MLTAILTVVLVSQTPSPEQMKARLDKEAKAAWLEYDRFAQTLQGHIEQEEVDRLTGKRVRWTERELKQSGSNHLIIDTYGVGFDDDDTAPERKRAGRRFVQADNAAYSFKLEKRPKGKDWVVTLVEEAKGDVSPETARRTQKGISGNACPHFILKSMRLPQLFEHPGFSIRSVKPVVANGKALCRVDFAFVPGDKKEGNTHLFREGWFTLDPDAMWCISEFDYVLQYYNGKLQEHGTNSYENHGKYPILKSQRSTRTGVLRSSETGKDVKIDREEVETCSFGVAESVPEAEFTLSHFGFPEPRFTTRSSSNLAPWIIGGAVVLTTAVVTLWWKRKG
jgi:hypothetical protein